MGEWFAFFIYKHTTMQGLEFIQIYVCACMRAFVCLLLFVIYPIIHLFTHSSSLETEACQQ